MVNKLKRAVGLAVLLPLAATLLTAVAFVGKSDTAYADGAGSPAECLGSNPNVIGGVEGTSNLVVKDVGAGNVVDGVCIKSGFGMFGGATHSDVLGNGEFSGNYQFPGIFPPFDNCYEVSGVGTQEVTVKRNHGTRSCKGISHIDVVFREAPKQKTDVKLKIDKQWEVASDPDGLFDESALGVSFYVVRWQHPNKSVDEGEWFKVKKNRWVLAKETVTGLHENCSYEASGLKKFIWGWPKFQTMTVTNTVTCDPLPEDEDEEDEEEREQPRDEEERDEGQVLGEATEDQQVVAPVGAVDAGAGGSQAGLSALLGLVVSGMVAAAGLTHRKWAQLFSRA